jgi:hypothetical protein
MLDNIQHIEELIHGGYESSMRCGVASFNSGFDRLLLTGGQQSLRDSVFQLAIEATDVTKHFREHEINKGARTHG